jgi:hypothetical protein
MRLAITNLLNECIDDFASIQSRIDGVPENHEVDDDTECAELVFLHFTVCCRTSPRGVTWYNLASNQLQAAVPVVAELRPIVVGLLIGVRDQADAFDLLVAVLGRGIEAQWGAVVLG